MRERPEPGAVIARLAPSHVRFGNFEHFHYAGKYRRGAGAGRPCHRRVFPGLTTAGSAHAALYGEVVRRTALMMAQWQAVGFAHGVMNTDNMSILGLTLDYGPFGFMDAYDPEFICNHTDEQGRYSASSTSRRSPTGICAPWRWRCRDLIPTETLIDEARQVRGYFAAASIATLMRAKLGLTREEEGDNQLIGELAGA